jgi:hypothetical protein
MQFLHSKTSTPRKISILLLSLLLILIPISTIATSTIHIVDQSKNTSLKLTPTKLTPLSLNNHDLQTYTFHTSSFSNSSQILPKNIFPIQSHPQLTTINENIFLIAETQHNESMPSQVTATYSTDHGNTWQDHFTLSHNLTNFSNPTIDYTGDDSMQAYGSCVIDKHTGIQTIFGFPNISNPLQAYEGSTRDFSINGWFNGKILSWDPSYA